MRIWTKLPKLLKYIYRLDWSFTLSSPPIRHNHRAILNGLIVISTDEVYNG
jgi:hypothetical protein